MSQQSDNAKVELEASPAASAMTSKLVVVSGASQNDARYADVSVEDECSSVDLETQARLEALLEAAGVGKLSTSDGKAFADPDVLHRLTSTVSYALDEAAAALSRLRAEATNRSVQRSLPDACGDGDIATVRHLLDEGRSVHETTEDGESLLSLACSAGYYELTEVLLSMQANIEERGPKGGCTPLMEAVSGGYKDIVELLIKNGADINAISSTGNTALTFACCGGYEEIVKILIASGANLEIQNENGHTPLMEAASAGHVGVAAILLECGAGINTHSNEFKESALTLACYKGHLEMVQFLLQAGADQEHKTDEMHTALMEASMDGHVDVARLLLDSGAHVNMPADSFESPLTLAACGGHVELASLLLARGANLEEVNDEGYTPLMEASREGHEEMVSVLLSHGANVNILTEETQETALTLAACGGFLECCKVLIQGGASLEMGCSTALMEAAQEGHLELVKYLLEQDAEVDSQTSSGNTALSYACEHGRTNVARVLLSAGACLEHESEGGRTPLMKAARAGQLYTVQYLISQGAIVNKNTRNNEHTVLSLACVYGHVSVVELLLYHGANPSHLLKDGSTMLLEAAKGGHTNVVQILLDFPQYFTNPAFRREWNIQGDTPQSERPKTRVPTKTLPIIVPPQEPDNIPSNRNMKNWSSSSIDCQFSSVEAKEKGTCNTQKISCHFPSANSTIMKKLASGYSLEAENLACDAVEETKENARLTSKFHSDYAGDLSALNLEPKNAEFELTKLEQRIKQAIDTNAKLKSLDPNGSEFSLESQIQAMHLGEDSQLLKKQRILEELQKVDLGLHEKASAMHFKSDVENKLTMWDTRGAPDGGNIACDCVFGEEQVASGKSLVLPVGKLSEQDGFNSAANIDDASLEVDDEICDGEVVTTPSSFTAESFPCSMEKSNNLGIDVNCCTESNNDTPLTLACAGGHAELVQLLVDRAASLEHKDKKGFSPLILAATGGHANVVTVLLDANADIESQSERTKDTALSLACSGGRLEVVEVLLERGANIEHRNVSDYTPLSLAASGGYVRIIELLLNAGAEINSRTGSKLGISPLMLAAMNGHKDAALLLLDMGADINAQIETNRNTALTLACFQGRHEVVSLLVERRANVEHRAKTGLTPLMEAASGGYAEVGRVLLERGADVNAAPVPSSRDTALTIAADKGHLRFCELVLSRSAMVDVRNKKGNTPFWLACNGGYLDVAKLLAQHSANVNTADNRNVTPLMAAFRKGHIKVVRWLSKMVLQFPSDTECMRHISSLSDRELLKRCHACMECISAAKERQAQEANKYASELLKEIDKEKSREESRKERAARKREKRRKKRREKQLTTRQEVTTKENQTTWCQAEETEEATRRCDQANNASSDDLRKSSARVNQHCIELDTKISNQPINNQAKAVNVMPQPNRRVHRKDEEWKEVVRKSKRILVPSNLVSRIIGRGGCNINAIREETGAHIDINKQTKGSERTITIRGPTESIRHARELITELMKDENSDRDVQSIIQTSKINGKSGLSVGSRTLLQHSYPKLASEFADAPSLKGLKGSSTLKPNISNESAIIAMPGTTQTDSTSTVAKTTEPPCGTFASSSYTRPSSASQSGISSLSFMSRNGGRAVNRPVQPVAPMISSKVSSVSSPSVMPARHVNKVTSTVSPVQPLMEHQRLMSIMGNVSIMEQSHVCPPNCYVYAESGSGVGPGIIAPSYLAGGSSFQSNSFNQDSHAKGELPITSGTPYPSLQNVDNADLTRERKIQPIGTERSFSQRRFAPMQCNVVGNTADIWSEPRLFRDTNHAASSSHNHPWAATEAGTSDIGNHTLLSPLRCCPVSGQFGNSSYVKEDEGNVFNVTARLGNKSNSLHQRPDIYSMVGNDMTPSSVGMQQPIGSHLISSGTDYSDRSMAAPMQPNVAQLQDGYGHFRHAQHLLGIHHVLPAEKNTNAGADWTRKERLDAISQSHIPHPSFPMNAEKTRDFPQMPFNTQLLISPNVLNRNPHQGDFFQRLLHPQMVTSMQQNSSGDDVGLCVGASGSTGHPGQDKNQMTWKW